MRPVGRVLAVAIAVAVVGLVAVSTGRAAACPVAPADPPPTVVGTEREVVLLRQDQAATCARLDELLLDVQPQLVNIAAATSSTSTAAASTRDRLPLELDVDGRLKVADVAGDGTLALTAGDRERLDLSWWGIWTIAGFILVLISAPYWERAWRFWRE